MFSFSGLELLILALKTAAVFVLSAACFDVVHYILHIFENSRFSLLRKLGSLHGVHHLFLDTEMKIQRKHTFSNLINHVVPEYLTSVVGMVLLGLVFGWLPSLIVLAIRTIMVIVYLVQKGEDPTHKEMTRINANRSLFFVGPRYHALHHVYVNQHYSSFVNVFDLVMGTNCQIKGRKFLLRGRDEAFVTAMKEELLKYGALFETELSKADVIVLADDPAFGKVIDDFIELGKSKLVPPEVWAFGVDKNFVGKAQSYKSSADIIYRQIAAPGFLSPKVAAKFSLFFIQRGFTFVPLVYSTMQQSAIGARPSP